MEHRSLPAADVDTYLLYLKGIISRSDMEPQDEVSLESRETRRRPIIAPTGESACRLAKIND